MRLDNHTAEESWIRADDSVGRSGDAFHYAAVVCICADD